MYLLQLSASALLCFTQSLVKISKDFHSFYIPPGSFPSDLCLLYFFFLVRIIGLYQGFLQQVLMGCYKQCICNKELIQHTVIVSYILPSLSVLVAVRDLEPEP